MRYRGWMIRMLVLVLVLWGVLWGENVSFPGAPTKTPRTEKALWQWYHRVLKRVVVPLEFEGVYGDFHHNAVDYKAKYQEPYPTVSNLLDWQQKALTRIIPSHFTRTPQEVLAFWVNVYNFYALKSAIERYPNDPLQATEWKKRICLVGRKKYSLHRLHRKVLMPMKDARVHFVLANGAVSGPMVLGRPFLSADVEEEIKLILQEALRDPVHVLGTGEEAKKLVVAGVFEQFKKTFKTDSHQGTLVFVQHHGPKAYRHVMVMEVGLAYDWGFNMEENIMRHYGNLSHRTGIRVRLKKK